MGIQRRVGAYVLEQPLGRGGMGEVWSATHDTTKKTVALKVLTALDPESLARFRREAELARSLRHPNLTAVLDAGVEGNVPFIAFELIGGGSLRDRLRTEGRLSPIETTAIGAEIAAALEVIHEHGLIHRDLKPENILLDEAGHVHVTDFGLARATGKKTELTRTGEALGSAAYMAPEQARGDERIDARADLYALGVVLFELLTGEAPFKGTSLALLVAQVATPPSPPSALGIVLPRELDALVLALLAKAATERPSSAGAVRERLETIARALSTDRGRRGRRLALIGTGVVAAVLLPIVAVLTRPAPIDVVAPSPSPRASPTPLVTVAAASPSPTPTPPADDRDVGPPPTTPRTAAEASELSEKALQERMPRAALAYAREAVRLDPKLLAALWARRKARLALGRPDAPTDEGRALGGVLMVRSSDAYREKRFIDCADLLVAGLTADWTNAILWTSLGVVLRRDPATGDDAIRAQQHAIELAPHLGLAHYRLAEMMRDRAYVHSDRSDYLDRAIEEFGEAIEWYDHDYPQHLTDALDRRADALWQRAIRPQPGRSATDRAAARSAALADLERLLELVPPEKKQAVQDQINTVRQP